MLNFWWEEVHLRDVNPNKMHVFLGREVRAW